MTKCALLLLPLLVACAPTRFVEPVPKEHINVTVALGGPLFDFANTTIPMPLSSVAAGYGLTDQTTLFAGLHTTALLFKDLQLDLGGLKEVLRQDHLAPGMSISPVANVFLAMRDGSFRVWPEVDVNAYWHYGKSGNMIYLTSGNWFELSSTRADGEPQQDHWIANVGLGHRFEGANWEYTTELKYLALGIANTPNAVGYHGIGGNGTFGIYLAFTRKF